MKRCPQCDFIYEDDQSLCDMDGVLLVLDARHLPASGVSERTQTKRNRAVPAFATLILALVLGMVYYVSIHRRATQHVDITPSAASTVEPAPVVNPMPEPASSQEAQVQPPEEIKPETARQTSPAKKQPVKANSANKPAPEPKKEDSKVGSILKKTGHILKKPFKF